MNKKSEFSPTVYKGKTTHNTNSFVCCVYLWCQKGIGMLDHSVRDCRFTSVELNHTFSVRHAVHSACVTRASDTPPYISQIHMPFQAVDKSIEQLKMLGAVEGDEHYKITKLGRKMAAFPVDPRMSKALISAHSNHCLYVYLSFCHRSTWLSWSDLNLVSCRRWKLFEELTSSAIQNFPSTRVRII